MPRISTRFTYPRGASPHSALDCNINNSLPRHQRKTGPNSVGYTQPRGDNSPWKSPYPNGRIGPLMSPNAGHSPGLGRTWALGRGWRLKLRREPHIVKSAVYACPRRSRGPGQCGRGPAPHKSLAGLGFQGGRQIPCSGIRIPCSGSNSALKFPARLRREFCKKTMQFQRISHTPFA